MERRQQFARESIAVTAPGHWLRQVCLPFWADRGLDRRHGGFFERLALDGSPDTLAPKRLRVQMRQIFVFAHAHATGVWSGGLEAAVSALDWIEARAWAPDGQPGFVTLLQPDGSPATSLRDTYDHAFAILGLSWLARATGRDPRVVRLLERTLDFVRSALALPDGSFREDPAGHLPRRQNPHMHMFEAFLALEEAMGWPDALEHARSVRTLVFSRMFDAGTGTIGEFFDGDLNPLAGQEGDRVEPGHMAEWAWLLVRHDELAGGGGLGAPAALLAFAEATAREETGLLPDAVDRAGRLLTATSRLWPQAERAKAWAAQARNGHTDAAGRALRIWADTARRYLDQPLPGCWRDTLSEDGELVCTHVQASTLYHIYVAALEIEALEGLKTPV